jgi:hypothetical protein
MRKTPYKYAKIYYINEISNIPPLPPLFLISPSSRGGLIPPKKWKNDSDSNLLECSR